MIWVFATSTRAALTKTNVRRRIIEKAVENANADMERRRTEPLPHLRPHSLRRTSATVLCALGRDTPFAKSQMATRPPAC